MESHLNHDGNRWIALAERAMTDLHLKSHRNGPDGYDSAEADRVASMRATVTTSLAGQPGHTRRPMTQ